MNISSYKDLVVWQKSLKLALLVYKVTKDFPKEEMYGLTSRVRRAASSMPANIAEGSARGYRKEYINFLCIAYASGAELETHLIVAKELGYIKASSFDEVSAYLTEIMKMLNGLIRKLRF